MASVLASVGLALSTGTGHGLDPSKYNQQHVACIASWKRIEKTAQLTPLGSRQGMLVGSCSIVEEGADMVEGTDGADDGEGIELAADVLAGVAVGWAGPIT